MTHRRPYHRPVELKVMCTECGENIRHKCNDATSGTLRAAFLKFLTWVPEFGLHESVKKAIQKEGEKEGWLDKGQDFTKHPFFGAQPWTYGMLGKQGGREFEGKISALIDAAGFDISELRHVAYQQMEKVRQENEARDTRRATMKKAEADAVKLFKSKKASLDEKVVVLDQIITAYTSSCNPMEFENKKKNRIEDDWLHDTLRHLEERYEGGISPEVNRLRIEAARKVAMDTGIFAVNLFSADGQNVFSRRFKTRDEIVLFVMQLVAKYDPLSEDPFARTVFVKVKERGKWETENFARGPKGDWIQMPKQERSV